jgi:hypothetical protein
MAGEDRVSRKNQFALALAQGIPIARWARDNQITKRTAYRWAREENVQKAVDDCRRRAIDRAIGQMTKKATWAVGRMTDLAQTADSESVQLSAVKALLGNLMAISRHSALEGRMAKVEEQLRQQQSPGKPDQGATS